MHIYPFIDIDLSSLGEQMAYSPIVHHEPSKTLPLKVFQAQQGTRLHWTRRCRRAGHRTDRVRAGICPEA